MFNVTKAAVARLAEELDKMKTSTDKVVRFCRQKGAMHLRLSEMAAGDQGFAHKGKVVLVVEESLVQKLTRRTLDIKETASGTKLCLAKTA